MARDRTVADQCTIRAIVRAKYRSATATDEIAFSSGFWGSHSWNGAHHDRSRQVPTSMATFRGGNEVATKAHEVPGDRGAAIENRADLVSVERFGTFMR